MVARIKDIANKIALAQNSNQIENERYPELEKEICILDKEIIKNSNGIKDQNYTMDEKDKENIEEINKLSKELEMQLNIKNKVNDELNRVLERRDTLIQECDNIKKTIMNNNNNLEKSKQHIIEVRCNIYKSEEIKEADFKNQSKLESINKNLSLKLSKQIEKEKEYFNEAMNLEYEIHKLKGKPYSILITDRKSVV